MGSWNGAHVRALEFFGGCPELVDPDNTRTLCRGLAATSPSESDLPGHGYALRHRCAAHAPAQASRQGRGRVWSADAQRWTWLLYGIASSSL